MVTDTCTSFEGKKAIKKNKSQILVSIQAVLHTNNATVEVQNKENKIFKIIKHSNRNTRHVIATLKGGGGRRWIKQQIYQLNTRQRNWKRSYSNYTQPVKSASHHQRRANQQASYAARDQSKQKKNKTKGLAAHPVEYTSYRKRRRRKKRRQKRSNAGGASPHGNTEKQTWGGVQSEQHIQMQIFWWTATSRARTHKHAHLIVFSFWISLCMIKQWNEEWSKSKYTDKEFKKDGGHHHSSKIKQRKKKLGTNHGCETLPGISDQYHTPERPQKHMITNTHHQVPNWSKV